jgi:hypothetical protein
MLTSKACFPSFEQEFQSDSGVVQAKGSLVDGLVVWKQKEAVIEKPRVRANHIE